MAGDAGADPNYLPHPTITTDQAKYMLPAGTRSLSQSVDQTSSQHVSDPFCFGRIAALHAPLSDMTPVATGHQPLSALTTVILQQGAMKTYRLTI